MWTIQPTSQPAAQPLTLLDVKRNLRLALSDVNHDRLIEPQIAAAVRQVEHDCNQTLIIRDYRLSMVAFPFNGAPIDTRVDPLRSVTSVKYLDNDGTEQTLAPGTYNIDLGRNQIFLNSGNTWPETIEQQNAVTVDLTAGYGMNASDVPPELLEAAQLQIGRWFRDPMMEDDAVEDKAYERIVARYRRSSYP